MIPQPWHVELYQCARQGMDLKFWQQQCVALPRSANVIPNSGIVSAFLY